VTPTHLAEVEDGYEQIQMYRGKDNAQDPRVHFIALCPVFRGGRQCGAARYRYVFCAAPGHFEYSVDERTEE
jgi:hypothetical protein